MEKPYKAEIGGSGWKEGPAAQFATIEECRQFAESYGTTADWCVITDGTGVVSRHRRDANGDGTRWFIAC